MPRPADKKLGGFLLAALALVGPTGCSRQADQPATAVPATATTAQAPAASDRAPAAESASEQEILDLAGKFRAALVARDRVKLKELFDCPGLIALTLAGGEVDPALAAQTNPDEIGQTIVDLLSSTVANEEDCTFLRLQSRDGRIQPLFRMVTANGLNYYSLRCGKAADGTLKIQDLYPFIAGDYFSATIRQNLVAASRRLNWLDRLQGKQNEFLQSGDTLSKMTDAVLAERGQEALDLYQTLPAEVRKLKSSLLLRMTAAKMVDEQKYLAAIQDFRNQYPEDAAVDLISIDHYFLKHRFAAAQAALDRVEKAVGGDPYLHFLMATLYLQGNKLPQAAEQAERAIADEPQLLVAYWTRIAIALQAQDHRATLHWLDTIDERFNVEFSDLTKLPQYADFVQSTEYQTWLKHHPRVDAASTGSPTKTAEGAESPASANPPAGERDDANPAETAPSGRRDPGNPP